MPSRIKRLRWRRRVGLLHRVAVRRGLEVEVWSAAAAATTRATAATASAAVAAPSSPSSLKIPAPAAPSAARFLPRSNLRSLISDDRMSATH